MHVDSKKALDEIDAMICNGDFYWHEKDMALVELYLGSWNRQMVEKRKQVIEYADEEKAM